MVFLTGRAVSEEVPAPTLSVIQLSKQTATGKTQVTVGHHLWSFQETQEKWTKTNSASSGPTAFLLGFLLGADTQSV